MINFTILFGILFCLFYVLKARILNSSPSDTAAGAIIMSCGIFINGAMKNISILDTNASQFSTTFLLLLWIFIGASFVNSVIQRSFKEKHLKIPIQSFAIGTWVAGTSVCGIAVSQRLPEFIILSKCMLFGNVVLWMFYMIICIRAYSIIFKKKLINKVHGAILLTVVSTQSIVVLGSAIYGTRFPILISRILIFIGIGFYILGLILIMNRYFSFPWKLEDDWQNTNCILHGAISITGLASVSSKAISNSIIFAIWLWVLLWFCVVEVIELWRVFRRVERYGFIGGIGVYDVTQWSRIFTFGMFYTFTMKLDLNLVPISSSIFRHIQSMILQLGTWVMVCILTIEGILFFAYNRKRIN